VKVLVQGGAQLNLKDEEGYTALDWAVRRENKECGEYLRSVGAKCCRKVYPTDWKQFDVVDDLFNAFALFDAASNGDVDRLKALVEAGAHDLNIADSDGWTALIMSASDGSVRCAKILVQAGAELNLKTNDGETALDMALEED